MSDPISFTAKTARFGLPYLFAGQAQKEFYVNQGLALCDSLLHAAIEGESATPPTNPEDGESWLVGINPSGEWSGHEGAIACRQAGSWVMITPRPGMSVFDREGRQQIRYSDSWERAIEPQTPTGGNIIDVEARNAIADLVATLRSAGILAGQ